MLTIKAKDNTVFMTILFSIKIVEAALLRERFFLCITKMLQIYLRKVFHKILYTTNNDDTQFLFIFSEVIEKFDELVHFMHILNLCKICTR